MIVRQKQDGERGAILVHVAFGLIALMAFSTFVIDYGVFWLSRRQAQNSADAGALAGAIALAFDSYTEAAARESALAAALANPVFGEAPSVLPDTDIRFDPCPPDHGGGSGCVRVDVYRNTDRGNPLPVFAGMFVGLASQNVRATATATVSSADTVECLKPWAVVDKWDDTEPGGWTTDSTYDPDDGDSYTPPTAGSPNSGFYPFEADGGPSPYYGMEFTLKYTRWQEVSNSGVISGWFSALDIAPGEECNGGGGSLYRCNIGNCTDTQYSIGDTIPTEQGNMVGPTNQGVDDLIAQDPDARWDGTGIVDSAFSRSPRIVPLVIVNPQELYESDANGKSEVPISNFLGFFVESRGHGTVQGRLVTIPGLLAGEGSPAGPASFATVIRLIR
jgi:Flp pilus assembly protein TadG